MSAFPRSMTVAAGLTLCALVMLPAGSGTAQGGTAAAASGLQPVPSSAQTAVGAPALSFTGRYVAHLATRVDQPSVQQLRRLDLSTGRSVLLNPSVDGGVALGNYSRPPVISADGTRVAFSTDATRLVAQDTNGVFDAFVREVANHATVLASVGFDGTAANGDTGMASMSKTGRYVVFTSDATDVVPGSTTTNSDVYLRDLQAGTTVQVTVRPNGSPSRGPGSTTTDVSADGHLVAFNSYDTDLAPADGDDGEADLFVRNMNTGLTRWLSAGFPAGANPGGVVLSPDGRLGRHAVGRREPPPDQRGERGDLHRDRQRVRAARIVLQPVGPVRLHVGRSALRARPGHGCRHGHRRAGRRGRHDGDRVRERAVRGVRLPARRRRSQPNLQGRALTRARQAG